jgi:hypothetical protein
MTTAMTMISVEQSRDRVEEKIFIHFCRLLMQVSLRQLSPRPFSDLLTYQNVTWLARVRYVSVVAHHGHIVNVLYKRITFPKFPLPFNMEFRNLSLTTLGGRARNIFLGGFGRWLPSHIAMRFREIQGLDYTDSLDRLVFRGLVIDAANQEEFLEIYGMAEMMATCEAIVVDRGAMAQFFTNAGRAIYEKRMGKGSLVKDGLALEPCEDRETLTISMVSASPSAV